MKKSQPLSQQASPSQGQHITASASPAELLDKAPSKIARVLAYMLALLNRPAKGRKGVAA